MDGRKFLTNCFDRWHCRSSLLYVHETLPLY